MGQVTNLLTPLQLSALRALLASTAVKANNQIRSELTPRCTGLQTAFDETSRSLQLRDVTSWTQAV